MLLLYLFFVASDERSVTRLLFFNQQAQFQDSEREKKEEEEANMVCVCFSFF